MSTVREFQINDWVEYRPWEDCREADRQDGGRVLEVLGDGMYRVQFGLKSIYGTRTGNYHWTKLYKS